MKLPKQPAKRWFFRKLTVRGNQERAARVLAALLAEARRSRLVRFDAPDLAGESGLDVTNPVSTEPNQLLFGALRRWVNHHETPRP